MCNGMPWLDTHVTVSGVARMSSGNRRTVWKPGSTAVPRPTTILNPRVSLTCSVLECAPRPEMIRASFGSATRQTIRNRMRRTTTAIAAMIRYVQSISPPRERQLDGASDVHGAGRVEVDDDNLRPHLEHLVGRRVSVEGLGGTPD